MADKPRILIVDDTPDNLQILGNLLKDSYDVGAALSGEEALTALADADYDLVLLDIMMPGLDGYEVCRRLRAGTRNSETPVIFLTAKNSKESVVKGLAIGGQDYIIKPFGKQAILERIAAHLRGSPSSAPSGPDLRSPAQESLIAVREVLADRLERYRKGLDLAVSDIQGAGGGYEVLRSLLEETLALIKKMAAGGSDAFGVDAGVLRNLEQQVRNLDGPQGLFGILNAAVERMESLGDDIELFREELTVLPQGFISNFPLGREVSHLLDSPGLPVGIPIAGEFFDTGLISGDRALIPILFRQLLAWSLDAGGSAAPTSIETRTEEDGDRIIWHWKDNGKRKPAPGIPERPFRQGSGGSDDAPAAFVDILVRKRFGGTAAFSTVKSGGLEVALSFPRVE